MSLMYSWMLVDRWGNVERATQAHAGARPQSVAPLRLWATHPCLRHPVSRPSTMDNEIHLYCLEWSCVMLMLEHVRDASMEATGEMIS
jgi:hypothetical protein